MTHKLRILLNSNAPWATSGYAQQARQFMPLIAKEGYPTAFSCFYGLEGGILYNVNNDGITYYPKIANQWGSDSIVEHSKHFKADVVFTLQDIWVLDIPALKEVANQGRKWVPIVPIDHEPTPPAVLERLKLAYRIGAMSPFGERQLQKEGLHSTLIPHTVQTQDFRAYDKAEVRKQLGLPQDFFIFGMVAANKDHPPRKSFQHVMDAFAKFHIKHPKSGLYLHTLADMQGGFQIREYAVKLGINDVVFITPLYQMLYEIPAQDMAKIYSSFDCLLAPSLNEGFGIPIIEAQSCEVPVITNDYTAMRDLVIEGKTGFKTRVLEERFTPLGSYVGVPDGNHLYELMEKMLVSDRVRMGKDAREFVVNNYDLDLVWRTRWIPFLNKLERECYPELVDTIIPSK